MMKLITLIITIQGVAIYVGATATSCFKASSGQLITPDKESLSNPDVVKKLIEREVTELMGKKTDELLILELEQQLSISSDNMNPPVNEGVPLTEEEQKLMAQLERQAKKDQRDVERNAFEARNGLLVRMERIREEFEGLVGELRDATLVESGRQDINVNSAVLTKINYSLRNTPELATYFLKNHIESILNYMTRNQFYEKRGLFSQRTKVFDYKPKFDVESMGEFLLVLAQFKENNQLSSYLSATDLLRVFQLLSSKNFLLSTKYMSALKTVIELVTPVLSSKSIKNFTANQMFIYSVAVRNNHITIQKEYEEIVYRRIENLGQLISFDNLLRINLNLSYAGFSPNQNLYTRLLDTYQYRFNNKEIWGSVFSAKERANFFFNAIAGALFNHGAPESPSKRFKGLFSGAGIGLASNEIFKVHMFYLYDYYVKNNKDNSLGDYLYYDQYRDVNIDDGITMSGLEAKVFHALEVLYPDHFIINEHSVLNWMPPVDFYIQGKMLIVEAQGPQHNIFRVEISMKGEINITRLNGSVFDFRKNQIYQAMGYQVIEVEYEHTRSDLDTLVEMIKKRAK